MLLCVRVVGRTRRSLLSFDRHLFSDAELELRCGEWLVTVVVQIGKREKTVWLKLTSLICRIRPRAQLGICNDNEKHLMPVNAEYDWDGAIARFACRQQRWVAIDGVSVATARTRRQCDVVARFVVPRLVSLQQYCCCFVARGSSVGNRFDPIRRWPIDRRHAEERRKLPRHQHTSHGLRKNAATGGEAPRMSGHAPPALKAIVHAGNVVVGAIRWNVCQVRDRWSSPLSPCSLQRVSPEMR